MNARVTGSSSNNGGSSASSWSAGMRDEGNIGLGREEDGPSDDDSDDVNREIRGRVALNWKSSAITRR